MIAEHGQNVVGFEVGIVGEDLIACHAGGEEVEEHFNGIAEASDARLAMTNSVIDGDPVQATHGSKAARLAQRDPLLA